MHLIRPYVYRGISCRHCCCEIVTFQDLFWTLCLWGSTKACWFTGMLFSGPWYISFSLISDGAAPALLLLSHLCLCLRYFWCAELGRYMCTVLPYMLAMLFHCSPNSVFGAL